MNYREAIDFLYEQLPAYQRIGKAAFKKDLTNINALCSKLGNPHNKFRSIHIAGTNGKGSVSHMLSSVFQEAGYTVGLYTSPHLFDFRERIKVNGKLIPKNSVIHFLARIKDSLEEIRPSFFEITVAMAFDHFSRKKVDIAIIETGLGGRLDSTNIITPELSVITNIGLDHMDMLGDSLEKIAVEKAGIIKQGIPVVIGKKQRETFPVFRKVADSKNAELHYSNDIVKVLENDYNNGKRKLTMQWQANRERFQIEPDLLAAYQTENAISTIGAVHLINARGFFRIPDSALVKGLESVMLNTGFAGRWQVINQNPLIILDGAHNEPGLKQAVIQLKKEQKKDIRIIYGCVMDKDLEMILGILPAKATYYLTQPHVQRARPFEQLATAFRASGKLVKFSSQNPIACLAEARKSADNETLILITGSIFLVGAMLEPPARQ